MYPLPNPSPCLELSFLILPPAVSATCVWAIALTSGREAAIRAAMILALWMASTAALALTGVLGHWQPPRMLGIFASILLFLVWATRQPWTERLGNLPVAWLIGFQSFRIIVEWLLHLAVEEGFANPAMTWTGTNYDIVAGVSALLLAPFAHRLSPRTLQTWNVSMAAVLLITVVSANLSAPTPFRQIGGDPPNTFISLFPFVWLPAVLVTSAWLGHLVLFRRLRRDF